MDNIYIFGDIHGCFNTLKQLVDTLPENSQFIFVGDLIDRGPDSYKVIKFVQNNPNAQTVLGNHEDMMITYGTHFIKNYPNNISFELSDWFRNGGIQTLLSYGLVSYKNKELVFLENNEKFIEFKNDVEWLKSLPLYIKLPVKINDKPIVISHSTCIGFFDKIEEDKENYKELILWNRDYKYLEIYNLLDNNNIFNIFGHTITKNEPDITEHYINLDTGCFYNKSGYGFLSCFSINENKIFQHKNS